MWSWRVTRSSCQDAAASWPRGAAQADGGEGAVGVAVDRLEHGFRSEPRHEIPGAFGAHVAHSAQIGHERLGVLRRQWPRCCDLDLRPVPAVVDPRPGYVRALAFLEVHERADEHHRRPVLTVGVEHRPAGLLTGVASAANGDLGVEGVHPV